MNSMLTMMIRLTFYFVALQLIIPIHGDSSTAKHCKRANNCALTLIPLTDEKFLSKPPRTPAELKEWCGRVAPTERCLKDFANKCLNKQSKQSLSILMYSFSRVNKRICTNRKRRTSFLNLIECGREQLPLFSDVLRNLTTDFHAIPTLKEQNLRIPLICCSHYKWKNVAVNRIINLCPTNTAAHEEVENLLTSYSGDLMAVVCGDYTEESDKCDNI
ncbi:hypothetical protein BLA29_007722, partial [Euroglyphus maynei]